MFNKPKILLWEPSYSLINSVIRGGGVLANCQPLAAISNNENLQGRVIPHVDGLIFIIKPEEFVKLSFDFIIIEMRERKFLYGLISQLIRLNVAVEKIKVYQNGKLVDVNLNIDVLLPQLSLKKRPNLFVDVSFTANYCLDSLLGIPRVVRSIYRSLDDITSQSVMSFQEKFNNIATCRLFESFLRRQEFDKKEYRITFESQDKVLLLDALWELPSAYEHFALEVEKNGLQVYLVIYDLIPIYYKQYSYNQEITYNKFSKLLNCAFEYYKSIICISRNTANDVIRFYNERNCRRYREPLEIYYFHMGFEVENKEGKVRSELENFVSKARTFLMVGTVEIRKNHITALKSLEKIIDQYPEENIQFLIIGKPGWRISEVYDILSKNPKLQSKILWLKDAFDVELQWSYKNTEALIFASVAEGFGLPIIEAANFGLPIICSDIPIFHEVAGENAIYFSPLDYEALTNIILNWDTFKPKVRSSNIRIYSWKECAQEILDIVDGKVQPYKILN